MREIIKIRGGRTLRDEEVELKVFQISMSSKEEQGRKAWRWVHTEALLQRLNETRLTREFYPMIPRFGCTCIKEWEDIIAAIPFREYDQWQWSVDVHNVINLKLGKPTWPYAGR